MLNNISFHYPEDHDIPRLIEILGDIDALEQERSKKMISERITQKQIACVDIDNKIIGFIGWSKRHDNNDKAWFIEQITIDNNFRKKGIGSILLNYFLTICKNENIDSVFATVQKDNIASTAMFQKACGIITNYSEDTNLIEIAV